MFLDLSAVSDDGLALILLRVPIKDLIGKCTQVSPQWNRILSESYFWRNKMDYDGYALEWPKLTNLSTKSIQCIALKHCFNRNFINDFWNFTLRMELRSRRILTLDPRWKPNGIDGESRIEFPSVFLDGEPEIPPGYDKQIPACLAVDHIRKGIVIKLADEGLTDEIMDKFRPTIVISEMVACRRDCASGYQMMCSLKDNNERRRVCCIRLRYQESKEREYRNEYKDGKGQLHGILSLRFDQGQTEGWHRMEMTFKDYPAGMRYLHLDCAGGGITENTQGCFGLKLANCSVKALLEKNAAE